MATTLPAEWRATTDIVTGDTLAWKEPVFEGSFRRPRFVGHRLVVAKVVGDSYGYDRGRHTFSLEVIESSGEQPLQPGERIRRRGKTLYSARAERLLWDDEAARNAEADAKHRRAALAKSWM